MDILDNVLIERLGLVQPWHRALFVGGVTAGLQHLLQAPWAYENGQKRPFALFQGVQSMEEDFGATSPTYVPWWFIPGLLGASSGVFV